MTDFRALCAELIHLNEVEVDDWTRKWADAVKRTKAALAQPEPQWPPKNCWLDDEPDLCPSHCVFDDPSEVINDCLFAREVKCKTDCKYYRTTLAQPEPEGPMPEVDDILRLAAIIRRVDGNHNKGAAALAEAILSHPDSRWQHAQPEPQGVTDAASRVAHYLEQRTLIRGLEPEVIHALHAGTDEPRQATLTVSDLEALARWGRPAIEPVPKREGER